MSTRQLVRRPISACVKLWPIALHIRSEVRRIFNLDDLICSVSKNRYEVCYEQGAHRGGPIDFLVQDGGYTGLIAGYEEKKRRDFRYRRECTRM